MSIGCAGGVHFRCGRPRLCIHRLSVTRRQASSLITASVIASLMPRDITVAVAPNSCRIPSASYRGQRASCFSFSSSTTLVMCHSLNFPFDQILTYIELLAKPFSFLLLLAKASYNVYYTQWRINPLHC